MHFASGVRSDTAVPLRFSECRCVHFASGVRSDTAVPLKLSERSSVQNASGRMSSRRSQYGRLSFCSMVHVDMPSTLVRLLQPISSSVTRSVYVCSPSRLVHSVPWRHMDLAAIASLSFSVSFRSCHAASHDSSPLVCIMSSSLCLAPEWTWCLPLCSALGVLKGWIGIGLGLGV